MRDKIPRNIFRGENLGYIAKHGRLNFPKDASNKMQQLLISSSHKASNSEITASGGADYITLEEEHILSLSSRHSENYLSFSSSFEVAKYFATNGYLEGGKVFKIDVSMLRESDFNIRNITQSQTHLSNDKLKGLIQDELEISVYTLKNVVEIPENAIVEVFIISHT